MSDVLVYAELRGSQLRGVARETVTGARRLADELGGDVHAVSVGPPGSGDEVASLADYGADRIFTAEDEEFGVYHPDALVRAFQYLSNQEGYSAILFPASARGKDLAPRVAARLDRGLATEITELEVEDGEPVVTRPTYADKAYARVGFSESPALMSIRPNVFIPEETPGRGEHEELEVDPEPVHTRVSPVETSEEGKLDVAEASQVVSGGRGMQGPENWDLLEDLVDALGPGTALGASRAVVDAGWRPHAEQVGQTGKVVSPNLYVAVGISGAIQHLAGMRTSNVIVAINKDPEAPIFDVADYGIVGDLFEVVPELTEEIRKIREDGG